MFRSIFNIIFLIGLIVYLFTIYMPRIRQYKRGKTTGMQSSPLDVALDFLAFIGWMLIPAIYIFTSWLNFADYSLPDWLAWFGVLVFSGSIWIFGQAYSALGNNWSPRIEIMDEHTLVTDGIYAYIRHPVYSAMWLWALSQPLLLHNWIAGFGLLVTFLPLYLLRVPREEQMMLEHFGQIYQIYLERTGRILPKFGDKDRS
jgi:protein-S-isoprenylcysteine O-methyltransferase Ste14